MKKIINFGSLNVDKVYTVEHFVQPGETLTSTSYNEFAGGKGLNQSIALSRAGADVYHAGKIGTDGHFLKQLLIDNKVDVSLINTADGPTGHAIIQVNSDGENSIILFGGTNKEITKEEISGALRSVELGDWLLMQNEISGASEILSLAAELGINVVFNPAPMTKDVLTLPLGTVKWLIVNEVEGEMFSGQKGPERIINTILTNYPGISLLLTLGSGGVHFATDGHRLFVPAEIVTPVDTTGAGDTFVGFFLAELVNGNNIEDCLVFATKAAASCVTKRGAAVSIPTRGELG